MSEGEKIKEKSNTDVWKLKQEEKKKKKEAEQAMTVGEPEAKKGQSKKEKGKGKKQQKAEVKEAEVVVVAETIAVAEPPAVYRALLKIDNKISSKQRSQSRPYQWQLVVKYLEQYITKQDIILYIGEQQLSPHCQQVYISGFNKCANAELVCRYSDITYFLESSVTKIFIEGEFIFANGSLLAKKGSLNLVILAEYYRIPVVGCGGSWQYNGWAPLSESSIADRYGESILERYDWIEARHLKSLILEVGSISPKQVSTYPGIIYKEIGLSGVQW